MKAADVRTTVRIPLGDIAADVAQLHGISLKLVSAKIDGSSLVLEFGDASKLQESSVAPPGKSREHMEASGNVAMEPTSRTKDLHLPLPQTRRKRRSTRRNRMKTRGWNVVTKATNSHGQTVTIYEPFVKALERATGSRRQKEKLVREILRANGNKPGPDSIRYYLENTLEYLAQRKGP